MSLKHSLEGRGFQFLKFPRCGVQCIKNANNIVTFEFELGKKCSAAIMRPSFVLAVATVAFVGFIILPVVAAIQNHRLDASALGQESNVNDRGAEFTADATSMVPSSSPSSVPSAVPSSVPSSVPSIVPSNVPSSTPSDVPSSAPTDFITILPTSPIVAVGSDFPSIVPAIRTTPEPTKIEEMIDVRRRLRKQRGLL